MGDALRLPAWFDDGGLVLRPPTADDVERITALCQDPDIQRFTRVPVPYTRADAESFVAMATKSLEQCRGAHLLVELDGTVVGCVGASIDTVDHLAVVGYWTAPEARRRGVTTRAMRRMCTWLLDDLGLARLELDAAATNAGSNAVAAALGFRLDGTRRAAMLLTAVGDLPATRVDANEWGRLPDDEPLPVPPVPPGGLRVDPGDLRLRPWQADDAAALAAIAADPDVTRWTLLPEGMTIEQARAWIARRDGQRRAGTGLALAIEAAEDRTVLGCVGLGGLDAEEAGPEAFYWLAPAARGRGVATTALAALCRLAFEQLGVARIRLYAAPDNAPSVRVAERVGFQREGRLRQAALDKRGRRGDLLVHGLLPEDLQR